MFLLLAVHLPLAATTGDGCVYLDEHQGLLANTTFKDQPKVAAVINACLLNTSLTDALNVTQQLNFSNVITFPDLPNINQTFALDSLNDFVDQVYALDISTFGYSYNSTADLKRINDITSASPYFQTWAESNVSNCNPNDYILSGQTNVAIVNVSRASIIVQVRALIILNNTLWTMKLNVSALVAQKNALKAATESFQNDFESIKQVMNPLIDTVKGTTALAYCGFVGTAYGNIKHSTCVTMVESFSFLALAFFLVGIFAQGIAAGSILLAQRYKADPYADSYPGGKGTGKGVPGDDGSPDPRPQSGAGSNGATFVAHAQPIPPTDFGALSVAPPQQSTEMAPVGNMQQDGDGALTYIPVEQEQNGGGNHGAAGHASISVHNNGDVHSAKVAPELPVPHSSGGTDDADPYSTPLPPPTGSAGKGAASMDF